MKAPSTAVLKPVISKPMPQEMAPPIASESGVPTPTVQGSLPLSVWTVGLYLIGLFLVLLRVLLRVIRGYRWSHQIRRKGKPVTKGHWTCALSQAIISMKLRTKPVMIWSEKQPAPWSLEFSGP